MRTTAEQLQNMSVNEKGFLLNRLRKLKWSGTICDGGCEISKFFEGYDKQNNIIIDSFVWRVYGLFYKDYLDTQLAGCGLCTIDPIKLEKAIDRKILWIESELFYPECEKVR